MFNTNQTRQLYALAYSGASAGDPGTIALGTAGDKMFFKYVNADGDKTRSDSIDKDKVIAVSVVDQKANPLKKHTISLKTGFSDAITVKGTVTLKLTFHQYSGSSFSDTDTYVLPVTIDVSSSNKSIASLFSTAIAAAIPTSKYPLCKATTSGSNLVIYEVPQKYVRGKLDGTALPFSVAFDSSFEGFEIWGEDVVTEVASNDAIWSSLPCTYNVYNNRPLADLEYFALGERGDIFRGSLWPNNYEPTYLINPAAGVYKVLSIEYYWAGNAENVQKSPRMIQVAGAATDINALKTAVDAFLAGTSGSGSGA